MQAHNSNPGSKGSSSKGTNPVQTSTSKLATLSHLFAVEGTSVVVRNSSGPSLAEPIEPGEIPQQPVSEIPAVISDDIPLLASDPNRPPFTPVGEHSNIIDQEEDPSNLDSDQGSYSDEGASESSSSHATPLRSTRGRKSKKKHREEKSYLDVAKGT